jgi:hypothetical protein
MTRDFGSSEERLLDFYLGGIMRQNQMLVVALLLALAIVAPSALAQGPWTITATVTGTGGTISPAGEVVVTNGSDQTFTITPNLGYHVEDVLVNGDRWAR